MTSVLKLCSSTNHIACHWLSVFRAEFLPPVSWSRVNPRFLYQHLNCSKPYTTVTTNQFALIGKFQLLTELICGVSIIVLITYISLVGKLLCDFTTSLGKHVVLQGVT